jgi:hypothetical protein
MHVPSDFGEYYNQEMIFETPRYSCMYNVKIDKSLLIKQYTTTVRIYMHIHNSLHR